MVYLVAMALIDLGRMRIYAATRWMWLVLSGGLFVTAPLGCDSTKDVGKDAGTEMPVPEYGAPDDWDVATEQDVPSADLPQVMYGPVQVDVAQDPGSDVPQVLYGPPPDVALDPGSDLPQMMYGPVQVDAADDPGTDVPMPTDTPQMMYGPVLIDATQDTAAEMPQVLYGAPPA